MIEWWNSLDMMMKILWGLTIAASLAFVIESVMTFIGADSDAGSDFDGGGADFDGSADMDAGGTGDFGGSASPSGAGDMAGAGDLSGGADLGGSGDASEGSSGSNLLSFRNMVNFFLGFGWTAILLRDSIKSTALLMVVAILVGVLLVAAVMMLFKWMASMQQSGTINVYKSAQGCKGTAYLVVPGHRAGEGKIQVSINGAIREYSAMTDGDTIPTGTPIQIIEVLSPSVMLVEPQETAII